VCALLCTATVNIILQKGSDYHQHNKTKETSATKKQSYNKFNTVKINIITFCKKKIKRCITSAKITKSLLEKSKCRLFFAALDSCHNEGGSLFQGRYRYCCWLKLTAIRSAISTQL